MSRLKIFILFLVLAGIAAGFYLVPRKRPFESYTQRAAEAFEQKNFERSIELYLKALRLYPDHIRTPEILLTIGDTYNYSLGNNEKAAKAYDMLTKRFPKSPEARRGFQHAGEMYEKTENFENALLAYQGIIDNFPDAPDIDQMRFNVAMTAVKLKKFEPARRMLMSIIDKNPETPIADQVLYQIGSIFFMEGATKQAAEVLKVAAEKFPDSPLNTEMQYTLANAYEEMGQYDNALKVYKAIRYTYPNPQVVEKKIGKISSREQETKAFEQKALREAKQANQAGKPGLESQRTEASRFVGRKKTRALDETLKKLLEGEPGEP